MSDSKPTRASDTPFAVDVEAGKNYFWCACGLSASQPFCDGTHGKTDLKPVVYTATENKTVYFCGCKETKSSPLCDGSHSPEQNIT